MHALKAQEAVDGDRMAHCTLRFVRCYDEHPTERLHLLHEGTNARSEDAIVVGDQNEGLFLHGPQSYGPVRM